MVLEKKVAIFDWEWGRNSALREGQKIPWMLGLYGLSSCGICKNSFFETYMGSYLVGLEA